MSLPDLCIAPYEAGELAPGEPLCAPATRRLEVRCGWKKTTYLVREVVKRGRKGILVQREMPNAPTLHLQFPVDHSNPSSALNHFKVHRSDEEIVRSIRERHWQRVIYFNRDLELLRRDGTPSHTFYVTGDNRTWWQGEWGISFEFLLDGRPRKKGWGEMLPVTRIEFLVNKAWRNENSDCHFALRWGSLTLEEKLRWIYEVEQGSFDQCEEVLRWFVISGPWWDAISNATFPINTPEDDSPKKSRSRPHLFAESRLLVMPVFRSVAEIEAQWVTFSDSQQQLLSVLDRYFGLHYNKECLRHQSLGLHRFAPWLIQVLEIPTHHERLEARLQLCDWLQDKVAPEEIPFLLGETA